ncbi:hypothetical protein ACQPXM_24465 [Kribbella sp. CA-253562]|uniref:hypothetical protein n=1 Tax=Kribbella sp. CA-253562 TaxID=3239942 RepID=UPI003D8FA9A7
MGERVDALRAARRRAARRRRIVRVVAWVGMAGVLAGGLTAAALTLAGKGNRAAATATGPASPATGPASPALPATGPEGIALEDGTPLAPASTSATGRTIDGISCSASEQVAYHIHTHLAVYVNGSLRPIPAGVGLVSPVAEQTADGPFDSATTCYYWLHVHSQDGIIHVESPSQRKYTLGQFFALWQQPLTADQVGPARGPLTVFVNGRRYAGPPSEITLLPHEDIQIDVGTPTVAPQQVDWSKSQL